MRRPPGRPGPTIFSSRPSNDWASRVGHKRKEFAALAISGETQDMLDRWAEAEFAFNTLALEGPGASRERAGKLAAQPEIELLGLSGEDLAPASLIESVRTLRSIIKEKGEEAALTPDILIRLRNPFGTPEGLRAGPGDDAPGFKPLPSAQLPAALDMACRWFTAESISELNPIEQAALALLRLLEIQPFERHNERTVLAAASLFTMRGGLQPIIIRPDLAPAYRSAIEEGLRVNTRPMVEVIAESVEKTIDAMIDKAKN